MGFTIPELLGGGIWSILVFSVMVFFLYLIFFCPFLGAVLWRFGVFEALLGLLFFRCVAIFFGGGGGGEGGAFSGGFGVVSVSEGEKWGGDVLGQPSRHFGAVSLHFGAFQSILSHFVPFWGISIHFGDVSVHLGAFQSILGPFRSISGPFHSILGHFNPF